MKGEYPNLPLIEERFSMIIADSLARKVGGEKLFAPYFTAEVWLQSFPNTAGLFQRPGTVSGQAFSDYYITVMYERNTEIYGVFQGNDSVYRVTEANETFLNDVKNRRVKDIGDAEKEY